jgi:micrococcal nuclease
MTELYTYEAELVEVIDGDTYDFDVDLGFYTTKRIRVRMLDVDTNETYGVSHDSEEYELGIEQKRFVENWFEQKEEILVKTQGDEKGKYGRWLAEVYGDGECLNQTLIDEFGVSS